MLLLRSLKTALAVVWHPAGFANTGCAATGDIFLTHSKPAHCNISDIRKLITHKTGS